MTGCSQGGCIRRCRWQSPPYLACVILHVNPEKCALTPIRAIEYIGVNLDMIAARAWLPQGRFLSVRSQFSILTQLPDNSLVLLDPAGPHGLGQLCDPRTRHYLWCFQEWLRKVCVLSTDSLDKQISLSLSPTKENVFVPLFLLHPQRHLSWMPPCWDGECTCMITQLRVPGLHKSSYCTSTF